MFRKKNLCTLIVIFSLLLIIYGCKKDEEGSNALDPYNHSVPVLTTRNVSNIAQNTAVSGGKITSDGGTTILSKGVCWSITQNPKTSDAHTIDGSGTADFVSNITGLTVGTTYYVRSYAVNSAGTGYGTQLNFTTPDSLFPGIIYAGGYIFYLDTSGRHGLVCAEHDQDTSAIWGCSGMTIQGADGILIGSGLSNTSDILADCDSSGIAAKVCFDLILNGYNDWFLPSKDELTLMYNILQSHGLGNFKNSPYWSSTEMTNTFAWQVIFSNGIVQGASKNNRNCVRAIRSF